MEEALINAIGSSPVAAVAIYAIYRISGALMTLADALVAVTIAQSGNVTELVERQVDGV